MPEELFRYVSCERAAAWEAVGWQILSGPVQLRPPHGSGRGRAMPMMIVEWAQAGDPVEPPIGYGIEVQPVRRALS